MTTKDKDREIKRLTAERDAALVKATLPESYVGGMLTTNGAGGSSVRLYFSDVATAEKWFEQLTKDIP